jgi:membrane associated rhomboid family serine protease
MIPIKDENPTFSTPVVTIALIVINIIVFFTEPVLASGRIHEELNVIPACTQEPKACNQLRYFACNGAIPYELTHGERAADVLARGDQFKTGQENITAVMERISCPHKNIWLSILKSMFLHGSILHIVFNMLFLWVFGNNVEDRLGKVKFVAFYLLAGTAAAYTQSYVFPDSAVPLIGASGAVAGILGAYILMFPRARVRTLVILIIFITMIVVPAWVMIGVWFLTNLLSSVGSVSGDTGVAYMAHVGGFLAGMLLLLIFRPRRPQRTSIPY